MFSRVEPAPEQDRHVDGKQHVCEERAANTDVRRNRAAEVTREQDCPEHRCLGDDIERETHDLDDADAEDDAGRIPELRRALDGNLELQQLDDRVEQQEEDRQRAKNAPDPDGR